ncbi:MAG: hypothetical protein AB7I24_09080 [Candidatus Nanopelagicales bacterium]
MTPPEPVDVLSFKASHPWAAGVIAAGRDTGQMPAYASLDWLALDGRDPRRLAALVVAAECWWGEGRPAVLAERLRDQLALDDHLVRQRIREASWDVSEALALPAAERALGWAA